MPGFVKIRWIKLSTKQTARVYHESNATEPAGTVQQLNHNAVVFAVCVSKEGFFHHALVVDSRPYTLYQDHHQNSLDSSYNMKVFNKHYLLLCMYYSSQRWPST